MYDAIVVGARCAGSPTAMLLARRGYRVLLVDRASFPRDTISTLIIWPSGVARLHRWGLLDRVVASNCPSVTRFTVDVGDFPLSGWGPPVDGVSDSYSPRRTVLDKILVDAAVEAGAELREGFSVQKVVSDGDRVIGIRGRSGGGSSVVEKARIVVGADGRNSRVARAVGAPAYLGEPSRSCMYYTYWSGVDVSGYEDRWTDRRFVLTVPTNDNLVLIVVGWPRDEFATVRQDIEGSYMRTIDEFPHLSERVRAGAREEQFYGTADMPNFFRTPHGPGWALVGDAGYHKDAITAYGISDAFRDAQLLADAIDTGFSGREPLDEALAEYERRRNEVAKPLYELTLRVAEYSPNSPRTLELRAALRASQADTDRYIGVLTGSVPRDEFFDPENIKRILATAAERQR